MKLRGLLGATLVLAFVACAESAADIPGEDEDEDEADADAGGSSSGSTLPPSTPPRRLRGGIDEQQQRLHEERLRLAEQRQQQ